MDIKQITGELGSAVEIALDEFSSQGADKGYASASFGEKQEFNMDGGEFSLLRTTFTKSIHLTSFKNNKKGSISYNRIDEASVRQKASECVENSESAESDEDWIIAPYAGERNFESGSFECDREKLFFRVRELADDISKKFPKILIEQLIASHHRGISVYKNTSGSVFTAKEGEYSVELMYSAHDGDKVTSFFSDGFLTDNLDRPFIELSEIEKNLSRVQNQLDTVSVDAKSKGVMMLPPCSLGSFLYDIISNFTSDGVILSGTSIWKDMLGKPVADERLTVSVDNTSPFIVSKDFYSSDGFVNEDFDIIKNGVLESFTVSSYVARKTGNKKAPAASFSISVGAGEKTVEDMISEIKYGVLVGRFSGGAPSANGDFSGIAKNSFLIEDGKITSALSETMINGNLAEMLKNIISVSKERICDGASVLPYISFDGITISGK